MFFAGEFLSNVLLVLFAELGLSLDLRHLAVVDGGVAFSRLMLSLLLRIHIWLLFIN